MNFEKEFKDKIILVTGGGDGIGREICRLFSKYNCKIAFFCRTKKNEEITKKLIFKEKKILDCLSASFDVYNDKKLDQFCKLVKKKWGGIDILINNLGGGWYSGNNEITNITQKKFDKAYNLNLRLHFKLIKYFLPQMLNKKWGRVIGLSTIASLKPSSQPWYYVFKKSIDNLYKSLSTQNKYVSKNITFNTILPGAILTKKTHWYKIKTKNKFIFNKLCKKFPQQRVGSANEVANLIIFLSSGFSSLINGAKLVIDGGQSNIGYENFPV